VEGHTTINVFGDHLPLDRIKLHSGQPLTWGKITLEEEAVLRGRNPFHVFEVTIGAESGTVLQVVDTRCRAWPQLRPWERDVVYSTSAEGGENPARDSVNAHKRGAQRRADAAAPHSEAS